MSPDFITRMIVKQRLVPAHIGDVWKAWTTLAGVTSFFAPRAHLDLRLGGPYEMLFDLDAAAGSRGSESCKILSYLPDEMLSFEWNAPPQFSTIRGQHTWVVIQLGCDGVSATRVKLSHVGWGEGAEWDQAFEYFRRAWEIVFDRLVRRFAVGPVDWQDPYTPTV
jgi:uncharacterized protein YndB with AHSA1/START domain